MQDLILNYSSMFSFMSAVKLKKRLHYFHSEMILIKLFYCSQIQKHYDKEQINFLFSYYVSLLTNFVLFLYECILVLLIFLSSIVQQKRN